MTATLFDETNAYVSNFLSVEAWNSLDQNKKNAIIKRAEADIFIYAKSLNYEPDTANQIVKLAVFEQIIHIAEILCRTSNGMTMISENITGFGSRKYDAPDAAWIAPRAQAYLQTLARNRQIKIIR